MLEIFSNLYTAYPFIFLIIWFVLLIKWADMLVDWASSVAKKFWISSLVIGLTIVAFWTSAPELVVNMMSASSGETELALSNVIWSNISNIFLVLWITAIVYPIAMPHSTVKKEIPFMIFTSAVLLALLLDGNLSRVDAGILSFFFVWFLVYTFRLAKANKAENAKIDKESKEPIETMKNSKAIIFILLWLVWLVLWGKLIVDWAVSIAEWFWLPKEFIGLTIIAIWTSLPELAASLVAAFKKETDMAIGWIVGSNIFNVLWILWATSFVHPLAWYEWMNLDLQIELIASILVFAFAFTYRKYFLWRIEWIILLSSYIGFITYKSFWVFGS